ncbi:MAG: alanyl-tRNA editing protein, partial [Desulfurococcaceae archaeon]
YIKKTFASVADYICERNDRWYVILDKTILHPKSGGQSSDTGTIQNNNLELKVTKVMEVDDVLVHYGKLLSGELNVGERVGVLVDWEQRYNIMKNHTAGHIIDYALLLTYKRAVNTFEANHGPSESYVAYEADMPKAEMLREIELLANKIAKEAREVKAIWVPRKDLQGIVYNAPNLLRLPERDLYRVVEIQGINAMPCTGTHVKNTGEIKEIKITKAEPYLNGYKLFYIAR